MQLPLSQVRRKSKVVYRGQVRLVLALPGEGTSQINARPRRDSRILAVTVPRYPGTDVGVDVAGAPLEGPLYVCILMLPLCPMVRR